MVHHSYPPAKTRRDALGILGMGAAAAMLPSFASAAPTFPKGVIIRTVLKDYAPEALAGGATLFHEHISLGRDFFPRFYKYGAEARAADGPGANPSHPDTGECLACEPEVDRMTQELAIAKRAGIACIVDAGHPDMGRDINRLRQLSAKSGLPIVAGAGFYGQPFYPKALATMSEEQIAAALIAQAGRDRAGAFGEIGSWDYMTAGERKVFRAMGRAHLATNLSVFTHTAIPGKSAMEQLDLLEDAGIKPERIAIGHLGNLVDPNVQVQRAICRRGAFIGFDRQGKPEDSQQIPMVLALIQAGFAGHLMFSSDFSRPDAARTNNPSLGYAKTLTVFVPKLKAAGGSDAVLHQIMVDNPRRFLAFIPPSKA